MLLVLGTTELEMHKKDQNSESVEPGPLQGVCKLDPTDNAEKQSRDRINWYGFWFWCF